MINLKVLKIKTASVKDLDGIEHCKSLESLLLGNCRQLKLISRLSHLDRLKKILLNVVTQVSDYEDLFDLPELAEFEIIDCRKISSISFMRHFPSLKKLILTGNTEIVDGDLSALTALEEVFYSNKKHYHIKYPPPNLRK